MRIHPLAALMVVAACGFGQAPGTLITVAGNGSLGNSGDGGQATKASIGNPDGIAVDKAGNLYIVDKIFNVVRKVDTNGVISTFAGGGFSPLADGTPATKIMLVNTGEYNHCGIAVDAAGNVYIADTFTMQVFKVDGQGTVTIVAGKGSSGLGSFSGDGGPAVRAGLNGPNALAFDSEGNLYISDAGNRRIRKVDKSGVISTVAGIGFKTGSDSGDGGPAKNAELAGTADITVDGAGNLYIADSEFIRKVDGSGTISTIAKGGFDSCYSTPTPLTNARVSAVGLTTDHAGYLYIADMSADCVQKIDSSGNVVAVAGGGTNPNGVGGPATGAVLAGPVDVALDSNGDIYIALGNVSLVDKVVGQGGTTPPANAPSFTSSGVVNGADFVAGGVIPGEIATIFGTNLTSASGINLSSSLPLPTQLEKVSVTVNGVAAPIFAVDSVNGQQQINFQVPWTTDHVAQIQVTNNGATSPVVVVGVAPAEPAIFNYSTGGNVFGAILHSDFKLANTADPAKAGETVLIYCTGLGYVTPLPESGVAATGQKTMNTATATIGGVTASVSFAGLAPGFVGLYQVNAQVPSGLKSGNQPVTISISGATSKQVLLPVE